MLFTLPTRCFLAFSALLSSFAAAGAKPTLTPVPTPTPTATASRAESPATDASLDGVLARKELRIGTVTGYIPFEMQKKDGTWVGFEVDMMDDFARSLGIKARWIDTKWEGIIPALHAGQFDVIVAGMSVTPERSKAVLFSHPYFNGGLTAAAAKKLSPGLTKMSQLDDAKRTIALYQGSLGEKYADRTYRKPKFKRFSHGYDAANALLLGRVDAFIHDKAFLLVLAKKNADKVYLLDDVLTDDAYGIAGRLKDKALMEKVDAFLDAWKRDGGYAKAHRKFFEDVAWLKDFPNLF